MHATDLSGLASGSGGTVERVWLIQIQAAPEDVDRIIDKVMEVDPLVYGRYERNAFVTAVGSETYRPRENSTSAIHRGAQGTIQTFPSVQVFISIEQDREKLARVLDAIREVHHYEEPLIFVQDSWASRANYDPRSANPNRWWNRVGSTSAASPTPS
jgi:hypothetical protein